MAMLVYASLHIISRPGYEMLINQAIEKAEYFADIINQHEHFELITEPELCLLTYRYVPKPVQKLLNDADKQLQININTQLDKLTKAIQKQQREAGHSFVSRTRIPVAKYGSKKQVVFRVVLANPLTTEKILHDVLAEQCGIAQQNQSIILK